jgi:hypothetical protein
MSIDKNISKNDIRMTAFPFDYVAGTNVSKIYDNLYNLIINKTGPLTENDFDIKYIEPVNQQFYFISKKYGFIYWHDLGSKNGNFTEEEKYNFISKYNRRYERLINKIKSSESIVFLSVNHFDKVYQKIYTKDEVIKLYDFLYSLNNNIKFVAINYTDENIVYNTSNFINLPVNRNMSIFESKELFTKTLYSHVSNINHT